MEKSNYIDLPDSVSIGNVSSDKNMSQVRITSGVNSHVSRVSRLNLADLTGRRDVFEDSGSLQAWLLEDYSVGDMALEAELKIERFV